MSMVHVVAVITAKPGQRGKILEAFQANVPTVRAEDGCLEYGAVVDLAPALPMQTPCGADTFMVIEKWASAEALAAHAAAPHMQAYAAKVRDHVASRAVHVLQAV